MKHFGGLLLTMAALVALTGCSASPDKPLTAEANAPVSASASPSAAPKAMSLKSSAEEPVVSAVATDAWEANEPEFMNRARGMLLAFGLGESKLSDKQVLKEGRKACLEGAAYAGHPVVLAKDNANGLFVMMATSYLCPEPVAF